MQLALSRFVALLSHDFCPDANRFVYWLKKPLSVLVIALFVALACALLLNPQAFAAVGGLAVIVALGLVWPPIALRGLSSSLEWERARCREGETVRARLVIKNRSPWPVWGITLDGGFRNDAPVVALARVAGFAEVVFEWDFNPPQRGVYPISTPMLSTGFPFGLWQARRACADSKPLIVWPSTMPLDMLPDLTDSRISEDRTTDRRAGDCGDLLGTRAFRQGDSLRRIHWAQSARHQRFIVTERQAGVEGSVSVVVDVDAEHHDGDGKDSSFEWTLRIAASICECLSAGHLHVECWLGEECFLLHGPNGMRRLLDWMAQLPAGGIVGFRSAKERSGSMGFERVPLEKYARAGSSCYEKIAASPRKASVGTFEILCTTDVGWSNAAHHSHVRRDHRAVVLRTSGQASDVVADEATEHVDHECALSATHSPVIQQTARAWVAIDSEHDVSTEFRHQWQRACRVA